MKQLTSYSLLITLIFLLSACGTDTDNVPEADDVVDINEDQQSEIMSVSAPSNSDYAGITLYIRDIVDTATPDGATAGTLQLVIEFENTTDQRITLPFAEDDYILTDTAGLNSVPAAASTELVMPELDAGERVDGVLEYAISYANNTFVFTVGDFESLTFSEATSD